jgi:DNA-binding GntR family transcriptional regulator
MCFLVTDMGYARRSQEEHRRLLTAWQAGDADRAVEELTRHIQAAGRKLVLKLEEMRQEGPDRSQETFRGGLTDER